MASIRPVTVYGEPVLHRRAAEVEVIDDEIRELIEDMYVTQEAAHGVGLAAPQVGVGLRIFTWTFPDSGDAPNVGHVINPVLTHLDKAPREEPHPDEHTEGCLSVPGLGFPCSARPACACPASAWTARCSSSRPRAGSRASCSTSTTTSTAPST